MAIEFKGKVTIKPIDPPERAASRLEALLDKHFPSPAYDPEVFTLDSTEWRLRDSAQNKSIGASVAEVFEEFREHDLKPDSLFQDRRLPSTKEGERGVSVQVHYPIYNKKIHLEIAGTNRMAVDGVAATCQRIKRAVEKPIDLGVESVVVDARGTTPGAHAASSASAMPSPSPSWLKRTWKDHTATFIVTLVAGVLVLAIGLWLGLSPNP